VSQREYIDGIFAQFVASKLFTSCPEHGMMMTTPYWSCQKLELFGYHRQYLLPVFIPW
jgi:hypothetical protein